MQAYIVIKSEKNYTFIYLQKINLARKSITNVEI